MSYSLSAIRQSFSSQLKAKPKPITISKAKSRLRSEHDPDKALEIYASVADHYTSPVFTRHAQDLVVKRLVKAGRFNDIETFIESHKIDTKMVGQEPYVCTLIRSYGQAGMFDHALKTYEQMGELGTPRSTLSFNSLLAACNQSGLFDRVPQLFDEMPDKYGIVPDTVSYGILIKAACDRGSPELGLKTLAEMKEKDVEVTVVTYTAILDSLYKKGMSDEAEKIWNEMVSSQCGLDATVYNVRIMNAHGGGDPNKVEGLIHEMSTVGLKPNTISYNYLMTCYCKKGMMDEAEKVFFELEENGCTPNSTTFRTLIFHLCKNEKFGRGYEVFMQSVESHKIPDFQTLKLLVEGLVKEKRIRAAKRLLRIVKEKFPASTSRAWEKLGVELDLDSREALDSDSGDD